MPKTTGTYIQRNGIMKDRRAGANGSDALDQRVRRPVGIIVNKDGTLISGHQRIDTIKREFGEELEINMDAASAHRGEDARAEVDWDEATAAAAIVQTTKQHKASSRLMYSTLLPRSRMFDRTSPTGLLCATLR